MTSEIQQNRYDRLMRRVAGIIGPGSKVSEVLTELFPMIDVEGDRGELQILCGTTLGMGSHAITAAGGETPKIQLFNPVGSGKLVTVTSVFISLGVIGIVRLARGTATLTSGIGTQLARDTRQIVTNLPTAQMFAESSVPLVDANMQMRVLLNTTLIVTDDNGVMILAPGSGISVGTTAAAGSLNVTFLWRERTAEPSELNL